MTAALIAVPAPTQPTPDYESMLVRGLQRAVSVFRRAGVERVVLVYQDETAFVEKHCARMNLVFVRVSRPVQLLDCIQAGLAYLQGKCDAVFIAPATVPLFSVSTVQRLASESAAVCAPCCNGQNGYPVLLRKACFPSLSSSHGPQSIHDALQAMGLAPALVPVDDAHIATDVSQMTLSAWQQAAGTLAALHPRLSVRIAHEQIFYGPGAHFLLQLVHECGSLSEACRYSGISYSKGRKIIFVLESQLGQAVLQSHTGGKSGGSSLVTPAGQKLMQQYDAFCAEAQAQLTELFQKHFPS